MKPISVMKHLVKHELRAQRGLVLLWLGLLVFYCFPKEDDTLFGVQVQGFLLPILALLIVFRSVSAALPANAEAHAHTLPLRRSTVFTAKLLFFTLALLLPWLVCVSTFRLGFGFTLSHWLWHWAEHLIFAAALGLLTAAMCSLDQAGKVRVVLCAITLTTLIAIARVPESRSYAQAISMSVLALGSLIAWWRQTLTQKGMPIMLATLIAAIAVQWAWTWDWRVLDVPSYTGSKLTFTNQKQPAAQKLWDRSFITGLPADHVAALAGSKPDGWSDFWTRDVSGNLLDERRWLKPDHAQAIVHHYPASLLWHGAADQARNMPIELFQKGSLLMNLAIHRMQRLCSMPLRTALSGKHKIMLRAGSRLEFSRSEHTGYEGIFFDCRLLNHHPDLMPKSPPVGGSDAAVNLLVVVWNPSINEARVTHEDGQAWAWGHSQQDRYLNFSVIPPHPYLDIAGLTLDEWIDSSTIDIWWPEEAGTTTLQVTAEQLRPQVKPVNPSR